MDASGNVGLWTARRALLTPEREAVVEVESGRRFSYRDLEARVARAAGWLVRRGVARGDRVALALPNVAPYLELHFACARLGAIDVPLNTRLAVPELAHILGDAGPALTVTDAALQPRLEATRRAGALAALDDYEAAVAGGAAAAVEPAPGGEAAHTILYTSGTTGRPKGALLPHRKTLFNTLNADLFFDLSARDRVLIALPLFHSFGLNILAVPVLYRGGTVVLARAFDPSAFLETAARERATFFGAVPTMFRRLLAEGLDRRRLEALRFAFTAGAPMPVETIHAYHAHGVLVKQGFGQTETSIQCCLDADDAVRKAGSVGRPVFHAEVRVVDAALTDVPDGTVGEIVVRGPITMLGYWRDPEATAEVFRGGWLHTGDLATRDAEGFLTLVSRRRDMYISGGENVYPAQVEAAYHEHPAIAEVAVAGVADADWGEVGRAYVVLRPGMHADAAELIRFGRERLAGYEVPRSFVFVASLPRTETGKVRRHLLAQLG
ncbi:MAG TPA: long-chain fatty acid--CoA ligase [Candidatus Binatia bacterium]|nr:long-chain fatty acid--CoA ligase [Candidatus Binatia bacterium]